MKKYFALILLLVSCLPVSAQIAAGRDTSAFRPAQLIAPGVLTGAGLMVHYLGHETVDASVRDWNQAARAGADVVPFDDYIQYVPVALDLGLDLGLDFLGAEARNGFGRRMAEAALAYSACMLISRPAKHVFATMRPNGANTQSFPSGHTCMAFTGAELVRMEYGWGWGAGAYGVATVVASMRVWRDWHWFSDVLAGAGIGILSAEIGSWLLDPVCSLVSRRKCQEGNICMFPSYDPVSGAVCTSLALHF